MSNQSLKSRILSAKSETEVADLLKEGKSYEFASKKTRSGWVHKSRKVLASFKGQTYVAPKQADEEFVEKKKDKRKRKSKV